MLTWLVALRRAADSPCWEWCRGCLCDCVYREMVLRNNKVPQLRPASFRLLVSCGSEIRALACPQLHWQAVVTEGDVVKPECLFPWWVFNTAMTMWTWTPCQSARSQKCCVCSLLNPCGFGRNVAGLGGCSWGMLRWSLGYSSGQVPGSSGDVHSSAASYGSFPISPHGRSGLSADFIAR